MKNSGIIFLGAPGAGKGTQAALLAAHLQIPHISTGEILRSAISAQTLLGQKAQNYVDRGDLVPDELILDLIGERLQESDAQKGWILDGFPRNVTQAAFLDQLLAKLNQSYDYVINLEVPAQVIINRLLQRGRKDDSIETITHRLEVYEQLTAPVIHYYKDRGSLHSVDASGELEAITNSLKQIISQK